MAIQLAKHWWNIALRGVVLLAFGIAALVWPKATVSVLVALFAAFALLDGVIALVGAFVMNQASGAVRAMVALLGLISIAAGVIVLTWPEITLRALIGLIGVWWIVSGVFQMLSGIIGGDDQQGSRLWLLFSGLLGVVAGIILLVEPLVGGFAMLVVAAVFAIIIGMLQIVLAFQLKGTDLTIRVDSDGNLSGPMTA
jgi:uncharacterized membrane protein HdeD (DUF308 family)